MCDLVCLSFQWTSSWHFSHESEAAVSLAGKTRMFSGARIILMISARQSFLHHHHPSAEIIMFQWWRKLWLIPQRSIIQVSSDHHLWISMIYNVQLYIYKQLSHVISFVNLSWYFLRQGLQSDFLLLQRSQRWDPPSLGAERCHGPGGTAREAATPWRPCAGGRCQNGSKIWLSCWKWMEMVMP